MDVGASLAKLGGRVAFFDQRSVLDTEVELSVGKTVEALLRVGHQQLNLAEVSAVYLRPYDWRQLPSLQQAGPRSSEWEHARVVEDTLVTWANISPALVVNRPGAMASNGSKPYQAALIRQHGFATPETLMTTDPQAVLEFWSRHGSIIYKSISGVRSIVSRVSEEHKDRLEDIRWCPTQFQEYVPGRDYRVHVVGTEVFATEIASTGDDYRYAVERGGSTELGAYELPAECASKCIELTSALGLSVSGIDLRLTPRGDWYCFEVNPAPGFTYFTRATGQPVAEAIARLLWSGSRR